MKKILNFTMILLLIFTSIAALTGCGSKDEPKEESNNAKAAKLYEKILENPGEYDFGESQFYEDQYNYSIVKMSDSGVPSLLLERKGKEGIVSAIKVFTINKDFTKAITPDESLSQGAAGAGGFRGGLGAKKDGKWLEYITWQSGNGEALLEKINILADGDKAVLKHETLWEGRIDTMPKDEKNDGIEIKYSDISDKSMIKALAKVKDGKFENEKFYKSLSDGKTDDKESSKSSKDADKKLKGKIQAAKDAGKYVVSGELKVVPYNDMLKAQGYEGMINEFTGKQTLYILYLDEKGEVDLPRSGSMTRELITKPMSMLAISEELANGILQPYFDKHIYVSFTSDDGYWQSDASAPFDEPRILNLEILE